MPIIGQPKSFFRKATFKVEVPGLGEAAFSKCSELSAEVAKIEFWEGGRLIPHKMPGRLTFPDITLERGATTDRALFDWFSEVVQLASGIGLPDALYKRHLGIVQLDRDGSTLRRFSVYNAWPQKLVAGDWDAASDDVLIESVTLCIDRWELVA
jgi:phage tail-like protein